MSKILFGMTCAMLAVVGCKTFGTTGGEKSGVKDAMVPQGRYELTCVSKENNLGGTVDGAMFPEKVMLELDPVTLVYNE